MSAYKRFVSYIYSYENGIKKDNVGYARIENYKEECRISIYLKDSIKREQKASVYLFYREKEQIQGIFMKEMTIYNGMGECKLTTDSKQIGGFDCEFEQIGGIIIYITANRFWGTEWDDKPIYGFKPILSEWENEKQPQRECKEKVSEQSEPELQAAVLEDNMDDSFQRQWQQWTNDENEALEEEQERYFEQQMDCDKLKPEEKALDCFEPYTKLYPFYEQDKECIGICPSHLKEIFPMLEEWENNPFVLYGYGRFRHILLLRKKGEADEYFIGVPGMYREREEKQAATYGFDCFLPMRKQKAGYGDFGYWCTKVSVC